MPYAELSITTAQPDEAASALIPVRTRANLLSLSADRGRAGACVQVLAGINSPQPAQPISTHPDHWYSFAFVVPPSPGSDTLRVLVRIEVAGVGGDVALWCEGLATAPQTITASGTLEFMLTPPTYPSGAEYRCALLFRSDADPTPAYSTTIADSNRESFTGAAQIVATAGSAQHYLIVVGPGGPAESQLRRYHGVAAPDVDTTVIVWPVVATWLRGSSALGLTLTSYELGTFAPSGLQWSWSRSAALPVGIPLPTLPEIQARRNIRVESVLRLAAGSETVYETRGRVMWSGGANTREYAWGQYASEIGQAVASGVMTPRANVRGLVVSGLYWSDAPMTLTLDIDGEAAETVLLPSTEGTGNTEGRTTFGDSGTLPAHFGFSRFALGCGDALYHGAADDTAGASPDVRRLSVMSQLVKYFDAAPANPVRWFVRCGPQRPATQSYIGAVTVREVLAIELPQGVNDTGQAWSDVQPPVIAPSAPIRSDALIALIDNVETIYERALRCHLTVGGADGEELLNTDGMTNDVIAVTPFRTSADLPASWELRCQSYGVAVTIEWEVFTLAGASVTSGTTVHVGAGVQTLNLTVSDDTSYLLAIKATDTGASSRLRWLSVIEALP